MGGGEEKADGMIVGINVTPLVDVVLVLLIIFMATAPLIQRRALAVQVPAAATGERATAALTVSYAADQKIYLEKTAMDLASLAHEVERRRKLEPELNITVSAEEGLPYGAIVELLDTIRAAGVKRVALEVRPKGKKK